MKLTKTTYIYGTQCKKLLWLHVHRPESATPMTPAQARTVKQGNEVGAAARKAFPGGILISEHGEAALHRTRRLVESGAKTLFEAAFQADGVLIRADIMQRAAGGWTLIEVKASTRLKQHHLHDLAVQCHVIRTAGLDVERMILMHVDGKRAAEHPDVVRFRCRNVTDDVRELNNVTMENLSVLPTVLSSAEPPEIGVGSHCRTPYPCPYIESCWADIPPESVQYVPRLSKRQRIELAELGVFTVDHLPDSWPSLTAPQRRYVECVRSGKPYVDLAGIRAFLDSLRYPIYFLDFETDAPVFPVYPDTLPYEQIPFQYSCHILHADGTLTHREYLHTDPGDPRPALVDALVRDFSELGSIVVYNAQFERSVLRNLADAFPAEAPLLHAMIDQLADQLDVFRQHYTDAAFRGSNSIKRVLQVIAPEANYSDLAIRRGDDAQAAWAEMIDCADDQQKQRLIADLQAYCERDTFAMVLIHRFLVDLVTAAVGLRGQERGGT